MNEDRNSALRAEPAMQQSSGRSSIFECSSCGGSGHIHNAIGEWLSKCDCGSWEANNENEYREKNMTNHEDIEILDWTRDGMIEGTEFVRLDDVHKLGASKFFDEQKARLLFEAWASPRGYSMARSTDSYQSQGTKSAWRGWWACARMLASSKSVDACQTKA